jgi:hypothetical protein
MAQLAKRIVIHNNIGVPRLTRSSFTQTVLKMLKISQDQVAEKKVNKVFPKEFNSRNSSRNTKVKT